jgi:DNA-binding CsgD family transcriptional regulator
LWYLSLTELHAGRLALAEELATRARELSVQYAPEADEAPQNLFPLMLIAAARGRLDRARELAELGAQFAVNLGSRLSVNFRAMTATLDAWADDTQRAVEGFEEAEELARYAEWREPAMLSWRDDYAQSLVELGRVDEAVALLDAWEADAERVDRGFVLADVARCRGLVAAARGDVDEAIVLLECAAAGSGAAGDPFGRARSLLALGTVRRRAKQKRAARDALEASLAGFEEIGAESWAETARAELGRIGGRSAIDGLTPAERRVADLVAAGHTNREVAAALFLGERTIASHLTRIYAKLGVRSRTELARRL